jgi:hypothetical protein
MGDMYVRRRPTSIANHQGYRTNLSTRSIVTNSNCGWKACAALSVWYTKNPQVLEASQLDVLVDNIFDFSSIDFRERGK